MIYFLVLWWLCFRGINWLCSKFKLKNFSLCNPNRHGRLFFSYNIRLLCNFRVFLLQMPMSYEFISFFIISIYASVEGTRNSNFIKISITSCAMIHCLRLFVPGFGTIVAAVIRWRNLVPTFVAWFNRISKCWNEYVRS